MAWNLLVPAIAGVLDKILPDPAQAADAKLRVLDLAQKGEMAYLDAEVRLALGQIEVNKVEAASAGIYKGGWRPATGWLCAFGLGYSFLVRPILPWAVGLFVEGGVPELPAIDTMELIALLGAMLGLTAARTTERLKDKA